MTARARDKIASGLREAIAVARGEAQPAREVPRLRTHPGVILAEEYMKPYGLSANALGQAIGVPGNRISDIVRGRRDVSADTAIRLGRYFTVNPHFWLNLQAAYDLSLAENTNDYSGLQPRAA